MVSERYLSARNIMTLLVVSKSTALNIMREAGAIKFGRNVRLSEEKFTQWLTAKKIKMGSFDEVASIIVGSVVSATARSAARAAVLSPSVKSSREQSSIPFTGPRTRRPLGSSAA